MFPRGHFLMKRPVKATCPDNNNNNLFQRIMALLSCYQSVSYRHTCACIQWSYSVDVLYTKQKKSINLIISVFLCNDLITRQQLYMARNPQPAARNPQPAVRRIVNLCFLTPVRLPTFRRCMAVTLSSFDTLHIITVLTLNILTPQLLP